MCVVCDWAVLSRDYGLYKERGQKDSRTHETLDVDGKSSDDGTFSIRQVSDRSELTVARSCTVVSSGLEACALLVVGSTSTAENVGEVDSRNRSTSPTLCRFDNLQHDLFNLSVNSRIKYLSTAFSVENVCRLHVQRKSAFLTEVCSSVHRAETDVSLTRLGADRISRTEGAPSTSPILR